MTLKLCYPAISNVRRRGGAVDMLCGVMPVEHMFLWRGLIDGMRSLLLSMPFSSRVREFIRLSRRHRKVGVRPPTISSTVCHHQHQSRPLSGLTCFSQGRTRGFHPPPHPLFLVFPAVPSSTGLARYDSLAIRRSLHCTVVILATSGKQLNSNNLL